MSHSLLGCNTVHQICPRALKSASAPADEAAQEAAADPGVPNPELVQLIVKDEIARRVTQMYTLECLNRFDVATARDMLVCLAAALERLSKVRALHTLGGQAGGKCIREGGGRGE